MCCLFGFMDYGNSLTLREKDKLLAALGVASEDRGEDATGIAYRSKERLCIYKRPLPARWMRFRLPPDASAVMGHTRMTTQGSERRNCNNHPFRGRAGETVFALAHNGILRNDKTLRQTERLPLTTVETDSFISVQLLEKEKALTFASLKAMAEKVQGSFVFSILDAEDNLWFVKGDNPLCIWHYEKLGLYVYASTKEILKKAISKTPIRRLKAKPIIVSEGELLRIDRRGQQSREAFRFSPCSFGYSARSYDSWLWDEGEPLERNHLDEIKSVAGSFGLTAQDVDDLAREGFTAGEIEEWLYYRQM